MTILVSGSYDAHLYVQNIDPYIELFSVAMFSFIAAQAMYFGWEHIRLFRREQRLTLNLQNLNESLEKQVSHRTKDLQTANERLSLAATTDVLTDLPNRRAFDQELEHQTLLAKKLDGDLCLAIIDIDWFKSVNDNYGHFVGDNVLQTLAVYLRTKLSEPDFVARIGGEEFAIIMPQSDLESAEKLLKQLCNGVADVHTNGAKDYRLSISIGCAKWHNGLSMDELYKLSDQALYRAKNNGRGRVEIF
jgi:diguanylate cyclase (GGDEF)-like protein